MNIYAEEVDKYADYSVTPAKFMSKMPVIKGWSNYCFEKPTDEEIKSWKTTFTQSGIDVCLGPASNVIALDIDTDRTDLLELFTHLLPETPVKKVGAKGYTLFYRYSGEQTEQIKFNGDVIVELLCANKKTTLPPSVHPNGTQYKWEGKALNEVSPLSLPQLPPLLFSTIRNKIADRFPDSTSDKLKVFSGRNNELSSLCGKLIADKVSVDEAINKLIETDKEMNEVPLFSDPEEMPHTEAFTNALTFYTNHLNTANRKNYRENKEYEKPVTAMVVDKEVAANALGKQGKSLSIPESPPVPVAKGILNSLANNILENSWIPQPAFALSASLAVMSALVSRKLVFRGISPNLYLLNIAKSGSGKNSPQNKAKKFLIECGAGSILGAGDYVSDASLMDSLEYKPVRLDIMDEAGGILRSVTEGGTTYGSKMADILAELFTSSDDKYLGRATAEGNKGSCYRPNVNILASTTPTGFSEGVSITAIQKGLLGRFLIFLGDDTRKATALSHLPRLDRNTIEKLKYWNGYKAAENENYIINSIPQCVDELKVTPEGDALLQKYFDENDELRINTKPMSPFLPVIARLYTQLVKIAILHCASRSYNIEPLLDVQDIEFAKKVVDYTYFNMQEIVRKYVFSNRNERNVVRVLSLIEDNVGISKQELFNATKDLSKRNRDEILIDLIDNEQIFAQHSDNGLIYFRNFNG
jgi:hypothetical protein